MYVRTVVSVCIMYVCICGHMCHTIVITHGIVVRIVVVVLRLDFNLTYLS